MYLFVSSFRSVLSPSDIVHFDQIVSPQEVKVLQHAHSSGTDEDSDEGMYARSFHV